MVYRLQKFVLLINRSSDTKELKMNEFVYQKTSKSDLLFNKDVKLEPETLEEGSNELMI